LPILCSTFLKRATLYSRVQLDRNGRRSITATGRANGTTTVHELYEFQELQELQEL